MIRDHDGHEDREAGFKPLMNVVPLIGVLAAVMVVMMMAIPGRSTTFDNDFYGCGMCFDGVCRDMKYVDLRVTKSGMIEVEGRKLPASALGKALRATLGSPGFEEFYVEMETDPEVAYSDLMQVLGALKDIGLTERQIRLIGTTNIP